MAITPEKAIDLTILHQIGLQKYSLGAVRRILNVLRDVQRDLEEQIRSRFPVDDNVRDIHSLRLQSLHEQNKLTITEATRAIAAHLDITMGEAALSESEFVNGLVKLQVSSSVATATVSASQLKAAAMSQPFNGRVLKEWADDLGTAATKQVKDQIVIGYLEGESIPQVVRRIRTASKATERGAELLARTAITHINARAVDAVGIANQHIYDRVQWLSVLDSRTSPICRARAGKIYKIGQGPRPPAHPRCRSGTTNLLIGQDVSGRDLSYTTWLNDQSAGDQRDILGSTRYKLWKDGNLKIDRFVNGNSVLNLDELRRRNREAFRKAGL